MSDQSQNGQISWKVWAIIALGFGLGISVLVGVARQSQPSKSNPSTIIAQVEDDPVRVIVYGEATTERQLNLAISHWNTDLPKGGTLGRDQAVERLIQQKLLVKMGQELGVEETPEIQNRLNFARNQILAEESAKAFLETAITEEDILAYYENERRIRAEQTQIKARQIVTPDEATAREIIRRLDRGEAFATLALAFSLDRASRESGGDMGYLNYDMLDPVLSEKIFAASDGKRLEPFETSQGWHIVEVISRRKAPVPSLDERREAIIALLKAKKLESRLAELRQKANVQIVKN